MKKGLVLILGTIMLSSVCNLASANAPTFGGVPDVVIGDSEFNEGLTADYNFFRYINAFNLLDYITDNDTAAVNLRAAFKEWPPEQDDDLSINDATQLLLPADSQDRSTWGSSEFTGGGANFFATFRDIARSPGTTVPVPYTDPPFPAPVKADLSPAGVGDLLPWHNTLGTAGELSEPLFRTVTLFVADEDNSVSDTFFVYSMEGGTDDLSGGFTTLFTSPPWDEWEYVPGSDYGLSTATSSGGGAGDLFIGMEAGTTAPTGGMFFGRWRTKTAATGFGFNQTIPSIPGHMIFQARYTMTANTSGGGGPSHKTFLADLRLGSLMGANTIINDFLVKTVGLDAFDVDPVMPAVGSSKDYNIFWEPHTGKMGSQMWNNVESVNLPNFLGTGEDVDGRTWRAYFDVMDADVAAGLTEHEGLWHLDDYVVGSIARPASLTAGAPTSLRYELNDLTSGNAFSIPAGGQGGGTLISVTDNSPAAGNITLDDNGAHPTDSTYLLWERLTIVDGDFELSWQADKIVRVTAWMSCPTTQDRADFHTTRIRNGVFYNNIISVCAIRQDNQLVAGNIGNPGMPVARDGDATKMTPYEVYLPTFGGPSADIVTTFSEGRLWLTAIDQVAAAGSAGVAANPTEVTVHKMLFEILDEPAGL